MSAATSFKETHRAELTSLLRLYRSELLDEVIPFWESRVVDEEYGGYFTAFNRQGKRTDDRKPGWFAGRTLYLFSALAEELEPRPRWLHIAEVGRRYLDGPFYAGNGRFHHSMGRRGEVLEGPVSLFTDHFATKGLYAYIAAQKGRHTEADMALAETLSAHLFANAEDPAILAKEAPRNMHKHAVNFMTLLAAQESRKVFGGRYQPEVDRRVQRSLYIFANNEHQAPLEYVGLDDQPVFKAQGRIIDPGHTMESLWFAMAEGHAQGRPELIRRAGEVLDWVLTRCYDEQYGGFYQHCDIDENPPDERYGTVDYGVVRAAWSDKVWWVQSEGLLALAMSALLNENERHYRYFLRLHEYTDACFRDRRYGEWYAFCKPDGALLCDRKGFTGKGPYHVPRCLLQLVLLLEEYLGEPA